MRIAGLFALIIFFPLFAFSAELININTADAALLDTLPGIGPAYAARIIDYRTVHGPFARIEDIQNVSGIGPSTYAKIESLITVGDTSAPSSTASSTPSNTASTTDTTTAASSGGGPTEYLPIPTLRIVADDTRVLSSGAETAFSATVYDGKGNKRDDALVTWSFGDGMRRTGASVFHQYYNSGEYIAVVRATTADGGNIQHKMAVTVKDANIAIAAVTERGISLKNNGTRTLDLSLWRLSMGGMEFRIPEDTQILAGHTTLFPSQIIELPIAGSASLLYPSGETAAVFPPASNEQPPPPAISYRRVSEVEPIRARTNTQAYEEAVIAPTAANELAAVGAVLDSGPPAPAPASRLSGIFKTPWTLGLLGVVVVAAGAFVLL